MKRYHGGRRTLVETAFENPVAAAAAIILTYILIWTLAQTIFFPTPRRDAVEIAAWAPFWPLEAPKHPPMPSWLHEMAYLVSGRAVAASYAVSMITLGATLAILFHFARIISSAQTGLIAVCLTLANYYFTAPVTQFNHNIVSLLFGAATVLFYREAVRRDALAYWVALGLAAAGLMLSKYSGALLLVPLAVHALFFAEGRKRLRSPGLYVSIVLFVAALAPHLLRVAEAGEGPIDYAFEQTEQDADFLWRIWVPLDFLISQIVFHAGLLLVLVVALWRIPFGAAHSVQVANPRPSRFDTSLVFVATLAPPILTAIAIGVTEVVPRPEWGGAYVFFSGLAVALLLPARLEIRNSRALPALIGLLLLVLPFAVVLAPHLTRPTHPSLYPADEIAATIEEAWRTRAGKEPLRFLIGPGDTRTYAVAVHLPSRPLVIHVPDLAGGLAFDPEELRRAGGVLLWSGEVAPPVPSSLFNDEQLRLAGEPLSILSRYHSLVGRRIPVILSITIFPPDASGDGAVAPQPTPAPGTGG
jgi:4-amino-4-deoxy-L-arabinose transferase-like glycosyltransferase